MKELKCPLCGKGVKAVRSSGNTPEWRAGCFECMWGTALFASTKQGALQEADELISKFPPIMRVRVGDKVIRNGGGAYKIEEVNLEDMSLFVVNTEEKRDALWLNQDEVALWPWEFDSSIQDKLKEFVEHGTKDWADVPDATKWVEDQRGLERKEGAEQ